MFFEGAWQNPKKEFYLTQGTLRTNGKVKWGSTVKVGKKRSSYRLRKTSGNHTYSVLLDGVVVAENLYCGENSTKTYSDHSMSLSGTRNYQIFGYRNYMRVGESTIETVATDSAPAVTVNFRQSDDLNSHTGVLTVPCQTTAPINTFSVTHNGTLLGTVPANYNACRYGYMYGTEGLATLEVPTVEGENIYQITPSAGTQSGATVTHVVNIAYTESVAAQWSEAEQQVCLSWEPASPDATYMVKHTMYDTNPATIVAEGTNTVTYCDDATFPGHSYDYYVTKVTNTPDSLVFPSRAQIETPAITPMWYAYCYGDPIAINPIEYVEYGDSLRLRFSWVANQTIQPSDCNGTPTKYKVFAHDANGREKLVGEVAGTVNSFETSEYLNGGAFTIRGYVGEQVVFESGTLWKNDYHTSVFPSYRLAGDTLPGQALTLSWNRVKDAQRYTVERSLNMSIEGYVYGDPVIVYDGWNQIFEEPSYPMDVLYTVKAYAADGTVLSERSIRYVPTPMPLL